MPRKKGDIKFRHHHGRKLLKRVDSAACFAADVVSFKRAMSRDEARPLVSRRYCPSRGARARAARCDKTLPRLDSSHMLSPPRRQPHSRRRLRRWRVWRHAIAGRRLSRDAAPLCAGDRPRRPRPPVATGAGRRAVCGADYYGEIRCLLAMKC